LRAFLRQDPGAAHALLEKLTEVSIRYLSMQVAAGAKAIQLFDSWAGLHDSITYREFVLPYNQRIFKALGKLGVPRTYLAVNALHLIDEMNELECEAFSLDWRTPLDQLRPRLGGRAMQGNLDPSNLLAPRPVIKAAVERVMRSGLGGAHVFNLGHGMIPMANPDDVQYAIECVRDFDRRV
jgi:uroporphyrinogen decarboxylase